MNVRKKTATAVVTAALLTGAVGCGTASDTVERTAAQVLTASFKKTAEAKSAKVSMTMTAPKSAGAGGDMTMTGVMGWDPTVMDMTMKGSGLALQEGAPESVRMIMRDNIMYMDMGASAAAEMDGKRWMKLDMKAAAAASGDKALEKEVTSGLDEMDQDPRQQLALLLDSPNLKHIGSEKIDGTEADHYKGTLTVKEALAADNSLDVMDSAERKEMLDAIEKSGIKGYDIDVWVNKDDLPVRMDMVMDSPEGAVKIGMKYSDYGAKAEVTAPPAAETFDLAEMFKGLGDSLEGLDKELEGLDAGDLDLQGLEDLPAA
ncbi:hypothetical protein ABZX85_18625 [Streptomyces sp. NPDC004539]|uniref:hypothetical protein n=1 Tax=Streptomyces sp. NPDC004539 TaxID=3154280 RepID=UPI0033BD4C1E